MYGVKFTSHFVLCIVLKINDCSDRLVKQKDVVLSGNGVRHAVGFGPGVFGEGELVVVDGEDRFGIEVQDGLFQALGRGVDVSPVGVILTVFENRHINLAELLADTPKPTVIASVTTDVNFATAFFHEKRGPESLVATTKQTI